VGEEHSGSGRPRSLILDTLKERTEQAAHENDPPWEAEPQKLLGELSRASDSLAQIVESLVAEKNALEARVADLQAEVDRLRAEAEAASAEAARELELLERAAATKATEAAREAVRQRARADRAERLLALAGDKRRTTAFCLTLRGDARTSVPREILGEAVLLGVDVQLNAHPGRRDSFIVAQVEADEAQLRRFLSWARDRFAETDFLETEVLGGPE
jgi:DNA repair exonuclease SbcCD ATPase subunit